MCRRNPFLASFEPSIVDCPKLIPVFQSVLLVSVLEHSEVVFPSRVCLTLTDGVLILSKPVSWDVITPLLVLHFSEFPPFDKLIAKFLVIPGASKMPKPEDILVRLILVGVVYHIISQGHRVGRPPPFGDQSMIGLLFFFPPPFSIFLRIDG